MAVGRGTFLTVLLSRINPSQDQSNERPAVLRRAHGRVDGTVRVSGPHTSLVLRTSKLCSPSCDINSLQRGRVVEINKRLTSGSSVKRAEG